MILLYAVAAAIAALALSPWSVGVTPHASLWKRLLYPFFHAGILHAVCNLWCIIAMERYYCLSPWLYLTAYVIAVTVPDVVLTAQPTVGLSGVCFALMGLLTWIVARRLYWTAWVVAFMAVGFIMPAVNAWLHVYCYTVGVIIGIFNAPIINVKGS